MKTKKNKKIIKTPISQAPNTKTVFQNNSFYIILLICITLLVFSNIFNNQFTNWDDGDYITENAYIKDFSAKGVKEIFSAIVSWHYHPLTLLSLAFDYHLWGANPRGFVAVNLLFHLLNVLLVFLIFKRFTKRHDMAFIVALIFAIHPMKVESVVWLSERKDVLYMFFYLLTVYNYLKYISTQYIKKYLLYAFIFGLLSFLSKALAASLPLILLLFDYMYRRTDYKRIILEKIPFFILALVFGIVAIKAQSTAVPNAQPLLDRPFLFTYALSFYIIKFFAPLFQSPLIMFPEKIGLFLPIKYYLSFLIIPVIGIVIYKLKSFRRELIFAFSFFLLAMILILIKFPIGPAYMAERYTHLPYLGMAFLIALSYKTALSKYSKKTIWLILLPWLLFLGVKTYVHNNIWKNSYNLWTCAIEHNDRNLIAYNNRGFALSSEGKHKEAIKDFDKALAIDNKYEKAYENRAFSKNETGDTLGALADYTEILKLKPQKITAYSNRATLFEMTGDFDSALKDYIKIVSLDSANAEAYFKMGWCYYKTNNLTEAINAYTKAIALKPNYETAYNNRGIVRFEMNDIEGALKDYYKSLEINPNNIETYNNIGSIKNQQADYHGAIVEFSKIIALKPEIIAPYENRGYSKYMLGDKEGACADWLKASQLGSPAATNEYGLKCK